MIRFMLVVALFLIMAVSTMAQEPEPEPVPVEKGAPEKVTLDTPIMQSTGVTVLVVQDVHLDFRHGIIRVRIGEEDKENKPGRSLEIIEFGGTEGRKLLMGINHGDFSQASLNTKILKRLQADGNLGKGAISPTN